MNKNRKACIQLWQPKITKKKLKREQTRYRNCKRKKHISCCFSLCIWSMDDILHAIVVCWFATLSLCFKFVHLRNKRDAKIVAYSIRSPISLYFSRSLFHQCIQPNVLIGGEMLSLKLQFSCCFQKLIHKLNVANHVHKRTDKCITLRRAN